MSFILFAVGFFLLIKGADIMVEGSSSIAKRFGVSSFVIGLTVVAFGTSAPELVVSALASWKGSEGIALGNIIGSNISNTLLILGVTALVAPLLVKKNTVNKEIPLSLLAVFAVGVMSNDLIIDHAFPNALSRIDGIVLMMFFSIFIYYTFGISKVGKLEKMGVSKVKEKNIFLSIGMVVFGLVGLVIGGKFIVDGGIDIASYLGASEALVGLTIVALGTSLPELAASVVAARKGHTDMAMGNIIGSNIFNLFWVLGFSALINPINFDPLLNIDVMVLILVTVLLMILIYVGKKNLLSRFEGSILLVMYVMYMGFLIYRG